MILSSRRQIFKLVKLCAHLCEFSICKSYFSGHWDLLSMCCSSVANEKGIRSKYLSCMNPTFFFFPFITFWNFNSCTVLETPRSLYLGKQNCMGRIKRDAVRCFWIFEDSYWYDSIGDYEQCSLPLHFILCSSESKWSKMTILVYSWSVWPEFVSLCSQVCLFSAVCKNSGACSSWSLFDGPSPSLCTCVSASTLDLMYNTFWKSKFDQ